MEWYVMDVVVGLVVSGLFVFGWYLDEVERWWKVRMLYKEIKKVSYK